MAQLSSTIKDYRTSPATISKFSKTFPSLSFYSYFVRLVFKSGIKAKQGQYDSKAWRQDSLNLLHALERIGVCLKITGFEHLEQLQPPYVVIANHMSTLETVALPSILLPFTNITFIVKQSLLKYPFFGHILRARDPIAVNRINPRQDMKTVMEEGLNKLKNDISIIVFPQTTRTIYLDPKHFSSIGIKLAQRADVPVVPLALLSDAWGNGKHLKDFGRIDVSKKVYFAFGEPMWVQSRGKEEHQAIVQFINRKLEAWKNPKQFKSVSKSC
ncbi:MAG: 1-acyl-sn-glycerol-3-phosphate acyltransferase [Deltaproteobacteria bacterium]|nr:1-acyl-sn-glycerol-3-phosphate acyltransferase [Deltaproteobacteria bacterium]